MAGMLTKSIYLSARSIAGLSAPAESSGFQRSSPEGCPSSANGAGEAVTTGIVLHPTFLDVVSQGNMKLVGYLPGLSDVDVNLFPNPCVQFLVVGLVLKSLSCPP